MFQKFSDSHNQTQTQWYIKKTKSAFHQLIICFSNSNAMFRKLLGKKIPNKIWISDIYKCECPKT